jgi:hypothetical protein
MLSKPSNKDALVEPPEGEPTLEHPVKESPRRRGWVVALDWHGGYGFVSAPGETKDIKSFGVGSVDEMFAAIPGIEVVGEGINCIARLTTGSTTKSDSAIQEGSPALPDNFRREIIAQWIRDYARDHPGNLLSNAIAHLVKATGHGAQETYRLFDVSNATMLVEQIRGVTTHGYGADRTLELGSRAQRNRKPR